MKSFNPFQGLRYFLERLFVRGTFYQFLVMAFVIGMVSLVGGLLVYGSGDPDAGLPGEIWWAFLRLSDPGYLGDDEGLWRRSVSTVLTVGGYVLFLGALVAILTQWLGRHMRSLEKGLTPVRLRHHIVILGWTDRTLPLLRELWLAEGRVKRFLSRMGGPGRLRIVVLAEDLQPELAEELRTDPVCRKNLNSIILRSGSALNNEHLNRAACLHAAALLVPARTYEYTGGVSSDVEVIKILLALNSQASEAGLHLPYAVTEIQDTKKVLIARRAFHGPLEVIDGNSFVSRMMVQNLRNPGLSMVCLELFNHGIGQNFYIHRDSLFEGKEVGQIRMGFSRATFCGFVRKCEGVFTPFLNPPATMILQGEDALVLLAPDYGSARRFIPSEEQNDPETASDDKKHLQHQSKRQSVLVVGWSHRIPELLRAFSACGDTPYEICIFSSRPVEERLQLLKEAGFSDHENSCTHLHAEVTSEEAWRSLNLSRYDSILMISSDRLSSGEEADARTMAGYLQLEALLENTDHCPHILLELSDPNNRRLLGSRRGEMMISPLLLSHLLVHVALRREILAVFHGLFRATGPEITFRRPEEHGLSTGSFSFDTLRRQVWKQGETLLGILSDKEGEGSSGSLILNPDHRAVFHLESWDRLVVIGTHGRHG
ncbi:Castor and Pollux protein voltage-gated ion channel component [Desulfobotulus alkaliphilus]|uniref:Castor and Pollux protein voltage-gated ion channel component n=1 Tax=Desulfobotulus alkaliphilus TaxID=622671 RepID=A0A562S2P7_9BACT|nr:ion channel DMI1 [Desulfobotulus alkaliphilus]TWI75649.1 Castor and Pollux protein voltage-gated ion channel component [Desulfobotulus alkaliphilus]